MADNVITNLSIQVTASADKAASMFDRLASGMGRVRNAASGAAGAMRDTANAAEDMAHAAEDAGTATANAGTQTGYAESHIRRFARALMTTSSQTIGRFITAVNRGASAVGGFIRQIGRILMYRSIRSLIKDLGQSFRDLYGWSRMFGTDFANSMDKINTAAVYLRNSFAAMVAPIINALAPAIDVIADKIVDIFNFVNQILAALSGADTYTVAKKVAQTWESTFDSTSRKAKKTIKEIRNTLLGFDEINRLNGNTPSSSAGSTGSSPYTPGYNTMFEEKPLKGFFKQVSDFTSKMPDWLKWLFGGAALIGGFLLLKKFLPWLLRKIGDLFTMKIPNWLKWLFGPRSDKDKGINIPDHIDLPDGSIEVDLKKGDWSALDDVPRTLYMSPKLDNKPSVLFDQFRDDWNDIPGRTLYLSPKLDNTAKVLLAAFLTAWAALGSKSLYFSPKLDNNAKTLYNSFKRDWDNSGSKILYFSPKLDNTAAVLFGVFMAAWNLLNPELELGLKLTITAAALFGAIKAEWDLQANTLWVTPKFDNTAAVLFKKFRNDWNKNKSRTLYMSPKLDNTASVIYEAFKKAWNDLDRTLYMVPKLDNTAGVIFNAFKSAWNGLVRTLYMSPKLDNKASVLFDAFKREWDALASVIVNVSLSPRWNGTARSALGLDELDTTVNISVSVPWSWDGIKGYLGLNDLNTTIKFDTLTAWEFYGRSLYSYLGIDNIETTIKFYANTIWWYKGKTILEYLGLKNLKTTVYVYTKNVSSKKKSTNNSFGGATGGNGSSSGGGAGRERHALGGIFSNGAWSTIPQYAGGTNNARGTMFIAGEAGPEIVGHIGGRTEVLNKSQLAATMYSAVRNAMSGITIDANFNNANSSPSVDSMEMFAEMVRQGIEQAMTRQNELDRQRNEYLREISEKDWDVDISTASINRAQTRMNRRAGTTIVPVGT